MAKIDLGSVVGPVGPKGPKPVKGTDYYTEEEKQQFTTETVGLVTTEGTKQTKTVTDEGAKQVQLITEKISLITSTGDEKLNAINQKSEEITNTAQQKLIAITNEGKTKLEAVTNEGNRVLSEIGKILETSPEGGNALQLGGKTRTEFDKEIQGVAGGYAGKFPLDSAVLDGIYLLPDTGKFYVCTKAFSDKSLIVPDSNFEELSVYKNRDRLSNLYGYELVVSGSANEETIDIEQEIFDLTQYNKKTPQGHFIFSSALEIICITGTQHTSYAGQGSTQIIKYLILPANTTSPCKICEISPRGVQLFNIKNNKIFYTAKHKENKYAVYINKLPIQFIY